MYFKRKGRQKYLIHFATELNVMYVYTKVILRTILSTDKTVLRQKDTLFSEWLWMKSWN